LIKHGIRREITVMYLKICQHHLYFDVRIYMYPFHGSNFFIYFVWFDRIIR